MFTPNSGLTGPNNTYIYSQNKTSKVELKVLLMEFSVVTFRHAF